MAPAPTADVFDIAVIGGGPAGMAAARYAAVRNRSVILFERESALGGNPAAYGCKAVDTCAGCSACVTARQRSGLAGVTVRTDASVDAVSGIPGAMVLRYNGGSSVTAGAVVVAAGFEPYDARNKGRFGLGRVPGVVSGLDADRMMGEAGVLRVPGTGAPVRRCAFIQCVGSRDRGEGRPWCSRVCCAYALRMAAQAASANGTSVTVFYMDIQDFGKNGDALRTRLAASDAVRFVRCIPGRVDTGADGGAVLTYEGTDGIVRETFDMVILSVGIGPRASTQLLGEASGIAVAPSGFIAPHSSREPLLTSIQGVYAAGTCRAPMDIAASIAEGEAAAALACGEGA